MAGFLVKVVKANQKAGSIVIPVEKIKRPARKHVSLVEEKKARKDQSILLVGQHHQPVEQKAKEKNGAKRNEHYKRKTN